MDGEGLDGNAAHVGGRQAREAAAAHAASRTGPPLPQKCAGRLFQVTKSMGSVVKGMDKVLASMNVEAISKVWEPLRARL